MKQTEECRHEIFLSIKVTETNNVKNALQKDLLNNFRSPIDRNKNAIQRLLET